MIKERSLLIKLTKGMLKKHFSSLDHTDIKYDVVDSYQALKDKVMG